METSRDDDDRSSAVDDLASVALAQSEVASDLRVPRYYDAVAGTSAGLLVAAFGLFYGGYHPGRLSAGAVLVVAAAAGILWAVSRFRALNGAWVSGLRPGATLRPAVMGAAAQVVLMGAAAAGSAVAGWWWLGLVLAPVEIAVFIVTSRRWMVVYRGEHGVR